jgi:hypothetical protein
MPAELKPYPDGRIVWARVWGTATLCYCELADDGTLTPLPDEMQRKMLAGDFPKVMGAFGIGKRVEFRVPDGRTFVVPPSDPPFVGNPVGIVLDIEARTRTRLKDGENPNWFIRVHRHFEQRRDPAAGVSFAEYCRRRNPDKVDVTRDTPATSVNPTEEYSPSALAGLLAISGGTLNTYAKFSKVPTPSRGKRDYRYTRPQAERIAREIIRRQACGKQSIGKCRDFLAGNQKEIA